MNSFKTITLLVISMMMGYTASAQTPCVGGMAGGYPCNNVDLYSFVPLANMGSTGANDIWGWTSTVTGKEYVLIGLLDGTGFFDISNPTAPVYLGKLATQTSSSTWRDIKTHENYAYIVSEASGHGIQVFDLLQLDNVSNPPVVFAARSTFDGIGTGGAHNIVIDECSGYAYPVGANMCSGGLIAVNLNDPDALTFDGCFSSDGYTHDAQCFNYIGPDAAYAGKEICLNSNENTLTIVDVTDKANMQQISRTPYTGQRYTHQGWATEDQQYYLMNDEIDESGNSHNTRTHIWDIRDLDVPVYMGYYESVNPSTDHNLYIKGNRAYLSNYTSGLRIYDITSIASGNISEVAYFDVYPQDNNVGYNGTWSNYPYFESGVIAVTNRSAGLFLVGYDLCGDGTLNCNGTSLTCGGSTCTPCTRAGCAGVSLDINFDDASDETSWEIFNDEGDLVASSYGAYASGLTNSTESACLADGCYELVVSDRANDGMCPRRAVTLVNIGSAVFSLGGVFNGLPRLPGDSGNSGSQHKQNCGDYTLYDANGTVLTSGGGRFGTSETTTFCLSGGVANFTAPSDNIADAMLKNTDGLNMSILPNVATDRITVTYSGIAPEQDIQLAVIDMTGKILHSQIVRSETPMVDIDVSNLHAGYYFVQLISNKNIRTEKFIVSK